MWHSLSCPQVTYKLLSSSFSLGKAFPPYPSAFAGLGINGSFKHQRELTKGTVSSLWLLGASMKPSLSLEFGRIGMVCQQLIYIAVMRGRLVSRPPRSSPLHHLPPSSITSGYMPRSGIAGSYGSPIFIFFEEPPHCFPQWLHQFTFWGQNILVLLISSLSHVTSLGKAL